MDSQRITEEELDYILDNSFNPPALTEDFTEAMFFKEWHRTRDALVEELATLGVFDAYGQGDFYAGDNADLSRGIGVSITSDKMLNDQLIPAVFRILDSLAEDYEVLIEVESDGLHYVAVARDRIRACCPDEFASALGMNWRV